ncbi:MAG: glycoside hydrolase family 31 protein [Clostridia bacterium]|nr:glycoside hydrolase family 31 protein [Clostridia bacterium]
MKKRLIAAVLLLATLATVLVGCKGSEGETTATTKKPDETTPIPSDLLTFVKDGKTDYQIVYAMSAEESVKAAAEELSAAIEAATGVPIPVVHDMAKETAYEIRVGKVSRMSAINVWSEYNDFGERDYAVEVKENHLYLYGKTSQAVIAAVGYFREKALYTAPNVAGVKKTVAHEWRASDAVERVTYTGTDADGYYAYFTLGNGSAETYLRLSFTDNNGWRVQTKRNLSADFDDIGAAQQLALSLGEIPFGSVYPITVSEGEGTVTVRAANNCHVIVNMADFCMNFYNANGACSATIGEIDSNAGGSYLSGGINPDEAIFGTGERFNAVNQRGKKPVMFSKDEWSSPTACYMVIPLLCFSRGSGIFLNHYEYMSVSLGDPAKKAEADTWTAQISCDSLDFYVYTTEEMSEAIRGYTDLSGHAEQPEEWTYGMILCRYSPDLSQKWSTDITPGEVHGGRGMGVYDTIAYMEAYDLPWTTVSAEAWGPYRGSAQKRKDLKELCDYVHALGKKFIVYMRVGWAGSSMTGFMDDYLLEMVMPNGNTTTSLPVSETNNPDVVGGSDGYPYLDITNPVACEWFFDEYWDWLSKEIGVDGCKIDFCETLPEYYELNYYDETIPTAGSHHWYPSAFCAKFFEMISKKSDGGMCYTRGGGIGAQRAPYMWAGDQTRTFSSLRMQLISVLTSGMSGVPFMSYDMSGYKYAGGTDPETEAHVFIRGAQYTAFTICMQQHGTVLQAFQFAEGVVKRVAVYKTPDGTYTTTAGSNTFVRWVDATTGGLDPATGKMREGDLIYKVKPGELAYATDIYRAYVKLHELLTPYITEYSEIACETGMPVMRPLALMWQDDVNVYDFTDEYMFGDAFLVAPVLTESFTRDIYLPEGEWLDLNTGETHTVGADGLWLYGYDAPMTVLPVFYNLSTTSNTAEDLLPGITEIFEHLDEIQAGISDGASVVSQ